uniref:Uncharacterized protein n=1 Tax=viral metagenome TaxID=1070528 RepID=A0A6C0DYQ8_9ZZZZ
MNDKIIIYIISENLSLLYSKNKHTYIIPSGYPYKILIKNKSSKNMICNLSINDQLYSSSNINYYDDYETENISLKHNENSCFFFLNKNKTDNINIKIYNEARRDDNYFDNDDTEPLLSLDDYICENYNFDITSKK